jgi:hypothetical protein
MDVSGGLVAFGEGGGIPVYPRDNTAANAPFPVAGTVAVGNTVTIAGTVTANPTGTQTVAGTVTANSFAVVSPSISNAYGDGDPYPAGTQIVAVGGWTQETDGAHWQALKLTDSGDLTTQVVGTVTVTVPGTVTASLSVATFGMQETEAGVRLLLQQDYQAEYQAGQKPYGVPIAFIDGDQSQNQPQYKVVGNYGALLPTAVKNSVTVGNLPSGALTTRFGSVTTAGTAQLTSAVTNANRKYLLLQNISTGAVTVGVGFVPTTTQGIALAAGAGLTFDAFCPTGAVHWLGATTGAAFTILEG